MHQPSFWVLFSSLCKIYPRNVQLVKHSLCCFNDVACLWQRTLDKSELRDSVDKDINVTRNHGGGANLSLFNLQL